MFFQTYEKPAAARFWLLRNDAERLYNEIEKLPSENAIAMATSIDLDISLV